MLREEVEEGHGCLHVARRQADLLDCKEEMEFSQEAMVRFSRELLLERPQLLLVLSTRAGRKDIAALPEPFAAVCKVERNTADATELYRMYPV